MVAKEEDLGAYELRFVLTYQRKHCAAEAIADCGCLCVCVGADMDGEGVENGR